MQVTVAICTWNRAAILSQTLAEMERLVVPAGVDWELLIVNNNCTDDTDEVIAKYSGRLPIRRLFEPVAGHTHARNCAVRNARGEILIWTDDDVLVGHDWLGAYWRAARDHQEAGFFGGPVYPWFSITPPDWLQRTWEVVKIAYAVTDLGSTSFALTDGDRLPFGANFGVRTALQRRYLFDVRLGRKGTGLLGGDETDVLQRLLADGITGWWIPEATVKHYIIESRLNIQYLRKFYYALGRNQRMRDIESPPQLPILFGCPRYVWRQAVESEIRYRFGRVFKRPESWVQHLRTSCTAWGRIVPWRD